MHLLKWSQELKRQPEDLVEAIATRRGGQLLDLDRALLWSEPLARGWNYFLKAVRTELGLDKRLSELAICVVTLATECDYEFQAHSKVFLAVGGTRGELDELAQCFDAGEFARSSSSSFNALDHLVIKLAIQMTGSVKVERTVMDDLQRALPVDDLVELIGTIAAYNMVTRVVVACGVE